MICSQKGTLRTAAKIQIKSLSQTLYELDRCCNLAKVAKQPNNKVAMETVNGDGGRMFLRQTSRIIRRDTRSAPNPNPKVLMLKQTSIYLTVKMPVFVV